MKAILASVLFVFAACGGSPFDPGAGDASGGGTQTLSVDGSAHASPSLPAATHASDFDTDFSVHISLNNVDVTTGIVTMKSAHGTTTLTFQDPGRWEGTAPGYDEVYQLDVVSGADKITGVRVDGPDIHVITAPASGAQIDTTQPLTMTWSRDSVSDVATLGGDGTSLDNGLVIDDTGTYAMAPNFLRAEKDQARTDTIRLTRTNRIEPAGAVAGSNFQVSVTNEIDVVALANPNLP